MQSQWRALSAEQAVSRDLHSDPAEELLRDITELLSLFILEKLSKLTCLSQVTSANVSGNVGKPAKKKHRSGCPVSMSLELLGDRWSLLIVRDLMVRGYRTFKEFQTAGEGIATNILSDRLRKLEADGVIVTEKEKTDRRKVNYRLTEKGIDLAPVLLELLIWGAQHQPSGASCVMIAELGKNREAVLAETRRRWQARDSTPLIPRFDDETARKLARRS
jgi:DNA-binding HxlR family transcriptional regulator